MIYARKWFWVSYRTWWQGNISSAYCGYAILNTLVYILIISVNKNLVPAYFKVVISGCRR